MLERNSVCRAECSPANGGVTTSAGGHTKSPTRRDQECKCDSFHYCRRTSSFHNPLTHLLFFALVLLLNVQPHEACNDSFVREFVSQPAPYYYSLVGTVVFIPCQAVVIIDDVQMSTSITFRVQNSSGHLTVVPFFPRHPRYEVVVDGDTQPRGLIVLGITEADNNSVVSCSLCDGRARNTTILVGDGRPFAPPEPPYQSSENVRFVTLDWNPSIAPDGAPVLDYNISYWLLNQSSQDAQSVVTPDNATTFDLFLQPNQTYIVVVAARNTEGLGENSAPGRVVTVLGEVPPAPEGVQAVVLEAVSGHPAVVNISWQASSIDPNAMTEVSSYHVYLFNSSCSCDSSCSSLEGMLVATVGGGSTSHSLRVIDGGRTCVGVAALNAAGSSEISFHQFNVTFEELPETTGTPSPPSLTTESPVSTTASLTTSGDAPTSNQPGASPQDDPLSQTTIITIIAVAVAASLFLVILIVLIFMLICCLRFKMKRMESYDVPADMESPPPAKKTSDSEFDKEDSGSKTELKGRAQNANSSNNLTDHHYATLPARRLENGHRHSVTRATRGNKGNGMSRMDKEEEKEKEEERYQSLPTLTTAAHTSNTTSRSREAIKLEGRTALQVTSV